MEERDIIIVGSGPAGLSAAMYTKPDGWDTLVLESNWVGGQGTIAYMVKNYPGFPHGDGSVLMKNMEEQVTSPPPHGFGVDLRMENVLSIDAENLSVKTDKNEYRAKAIVLATGSSMKKLDVPGEEKFIGKGVSYYAKLEKDKFAGKKILVVGGGNTTGKTALVAVNEGKASEVNLVHRRESLRTYPPMLNMLKSKGINILYNTEIKEIKGNDSVSSAIIVDNKTNEEREVEADWVVICTGTVPNTEIAVNAGIKMDGIHIETDKNLMTDKPGIFACGEIAGSQRHLVNAAADGASAGMYASEYLALQMVKSGTMFQGAKNGKYAEEYQ